jgi:hypothetical protein
MEYFASSQRFLTAILQLYSEAGESRDVHNIKLNLTVNHPPTVIENKGS